MVRRKHILETRPLMKEEADPTKHEAYAALSEKAEIDTVRELVARYLSQIAAKEDHGTFEEEDDFEEEDIEADDLVSAEEALEKLEAMRQTAIDRLKTDPLPLEEPTQPNAEENPRQDAVKEPEE